MVVVTAIPDLPHIKNLIFLLMKSLDAACTLGLRFTLTTESLFLRSLMDRRTI